MQELKFCEPPLMEDEHVKIYDNETRTVFIKKDDLKTFVVYKNSSETLQETLQETNWTK